MNATTYLCSNLLSLIFRVLHSGFPFPEQFNSLRCSARVEFGSVRLGLEAVKVGQ